jgi:hypothetical protein
MKKIITAVTVAFVVCLSTMCADVASPLKKHPDSKKWADLFAIDFTNAICPTNVWSWKDGELSPKDKDEVIWSKEEFENFILDLEFNLEPAANSGVFVYNTDLQNWVPNTIEIQLLDNAGAKWKDIPANWKCGGIFGHSVPRTAATRTAGEWNRMTILCQGPHISVLLNGKLMTDINMKDWKSGKKGPNGEDIVEFEPRPLAEMATKGRIGLQGAHGGIPTHFRNIKIKSLD